MTAASPFSPASRASIARTSCSVKLMPEKIGHDDAHVKLFLAATRKGQWRLTGNVRGAKMC
jgi:hypothetical protein